jgi:hypothetical protein
MASLQVVGVPIRTDRHPRQRQLIRPNPGHLPRPTTAWQGRTKEARTLGEDTARRSRETFGADHPLTLFCVSSLALARAVSGDRANADVYLGHQLPYLAAISGLGEDTLQRCSDAIGPDHLTTLGLAELVRTVTTSG